MARAAVLGRLRRLPWQRATVRDIVTETQRARTLVLDVEVSPYLVYELRRGDVFEVRGPIGGHFTWSADERGPLLLVAGGSGLVPLMSMLRHRAARGAPVEVRVLISARSPSDLLYADELAALQPREGLRVA